MQKTSDSGELVDKVRLANVNLIGIDGIDGSGKTTLSIKIAEELGYTHIKLDDYVSENCGTFIEHIRYDELRSLVHNTHELIILEGVCLLAVLDRLQRKADLLIYVRRISDYGLWYDEYFCDIRGDVDELILKEKESLRKFCEAEAHMKGKTFDPNTCNFPPLKEEIIRYHYNFTPHRRANIIYDRIV